MNKEKFWRRSYDENMEDIDSQLFETSYTRVIRPTFKNYPDTTAFAYMGRHISYAELDRESNRFARMLLSHGFKKGDVVGINLPNMPEYIFAWLGTLKAGCTVSGVSMLLSTEQLFQQLTDSRARALVTLDISFADKIPEIVPRLPDLQVIAAARAASFFPGLTADVRPQAGKTVYTFEEILEPGKFSDDLPTVENTPDDIAYLQYTGGTTGIPKGAMLSHRNSVADMMIYRKWLGWRDGEVTAVSGFPFFHIAGLFVNICAVYMAGTQVLVPNPRDTDHICREIERYKPSLLVSVPALYQMLMANPRFRQLDHSRVQTCISSASPFPEEAQKDFEKIVGKGKLLENLGMTEASPLIACNPVQKKKKLGTVGLPLINTDIRLIDPLTGKEVPIGEPGEICVKGPQVMVGYYGRPEETKKVIDADGYLHGGDVAVQDEEGYLRIVDRTKDMIIVGGYKVFSVKVEAILVEHPAVASAALVGVPNPDRPGSELVAAFVQPDPGYADAGNEPALKEEIIAFLKNRLAPYEMPKWIMFMKELPLTPVGKLDKKLLRKNAPHLLADSAGRD
ncbi:MAG: AMP-dependent synthetase [Deltaproteobacteria bacterium HGW-Deltaproteobacteria-6]|jgi:long-chain acyl-CoA synthetase|nr:MAG: AMP-dependent synthetase [Deltaproteobacteria bacterium HGW-Deltaproteobacteria-6]